jgi:hypothetical protein
MITNLPNFIKHKGTNFIAWEVNVWAWLEINYDWKLDTYIADHNNTILDIPKEYITVLEDYTTLDTIYYNIPNTILPSCNAYGNGDSAKKIYNILLNN